MHVQVITRVITCYPSFYWGLGKMLEGMDGQPESKGRKDRQQNGIGGTGGRKREVNQEKLKSKSTAKIYIRIFIVYGMVQAVLYGAFLPPA